MAKHPLTYNGFTSGWLQRFFNDPLNPICVMLAMRTKLLLDLIDEMGHSYNLLRNIGYGWIDWGDIPGETPGDPGGYYPPLTPWPQPDFPSLPPGPPGATPMPGEPGYAAPPPPAPPPAAPPPGGPGGAGGGGGGAGSGGPGGQGAPGSGAFGYGPGDFGVGGIGRPAGGGGGGRWNCCFDKDDPETFVHIGYTSLEMACEETQDLTVEGYLSTCDELWYEWAVLSIGGSVNPITGYSTVFTAPACGAECESPQTIVLYCNEEQVDSIEITLNPCPATASIGYETLEMDCEGSQTLTADESAPGCGTPTYSWTATGGSLDPETGNETIFTATAGGAECETSVTVALSCNGDVLDSIDIDVACCPATASIGYTTQGMSANQQQTLTVVPGAGGCDTTVYNWAIIAGGGTLSAPTGASVVYTAPATNAYCVNNPTIELSCNDKTLDSLQIAVNASASNYDSYYKFYAYTCVTNVCRGNFKVHGCWDAIKSDSAGPCECPPETWKYCDAGTPCTMCQNGRICDIRTDLNKAAGCCPAGLIGY